jgi:CrcB protein
VRSVLAVFLGGVVGTALRLGLDDLIVHDDNTFPWSTLIINVVGSLALGLLVARLWPVVPEWTRAGLGPGLLGGFTTFSAFIVAFVRLAAAGQAALAIAYLAASLLLGLAAAALGLRIGGRANPAIGVDE